MLSLPIIALGRSTKKNNCRKPRARRRAVHKEILVHYRFAVPHMPARSSVSTGGCGVSSGAPTPIVPLGGAMPLPMPAIDIQAGCPSAGIEESIRRGLFWLHELGRTSLDHFARVDSNSIGSIYLGGRFSSSAGSGSGHCPSRPCPGSLSAVTGELVGLAPRNTPCFPRSYSVWEIAHTMYASPCGIP